MLSGMLGISVTWLFLFVCFGGMGLLFYELLGSRALLADVENTLSAFWFGWCFALMILQIWHLFIPVDWRALFFITALGLFGIVRSRGQIAKFVARKDFRLRWLVPVCLGVVWLANLASAPIRSYDAGLYHLSAVRWISTYPIIPGLGNLHDRLGFNSSYFLYQALLDVGFWTHRSHHLASGLLLLIVVLEIAFSAYKLSTKQVTYVYDLMRILFLAPVADQSFSQASTTSPDLAMYVIGVLVSVRLCKLLFSENSETEILDVSLIMILSAIGTTVKLSFIAMGVLASLVAMGTLIYRDGKQNGALARFTKIAIPTVLALLILTPWIIRNVILTGYPLYPAAFLSFDVEWKVTEPIVANLNEWIQSWARNPSASPKQVLANWDWLHGWARQVLLNHKFALTFPLLLFLMGCFVSIFVARNRELSRRRSLLFFSPALGMLIFWFLTAPEPRYAGVTFWYLGAGAVSLACGGLFYDHTANESLARPGILP